MDGLRGKRDFHDLLRSARELIATVAVSPEPADTAWSNHDVRLMVRPR